MKLFYCTKCLAMQKHDKKCEKCNNEDLREIYIINSNNTKLAKDFKNKDE